MLRFQKSCLQVEVRIFLLSMQTGSFIDWRKVLGVDKSIQCQEKLRVVSEHVLYRVWSKNPEKLIPHLDKLEQHTPKIKCYVQYTLNDNVQFVSLGIISEGRIHVLLKPNKLIWCLLPLEMSIPTCL